MAVLCILRYLRPYKRTVLIIITAKILVALLIFNKVTPLKFLQSSESNKDYDPFGFNKDQKAQTHRQFQKLSGQRRHLDLHLEDGRVIDSHHGEIGGGSREGKGIAVGLAVTSKGIGNLTAAEQVRYKFPFFRSLLPSLCKTSTQGYHYHFYLAYDADDPFFTDQSRLTWFADTFYDLQEDMCSFVTGLWLHLIRCHHAHKPAWAQNDAMYEAYLDNMDYYYRVNDDTILKTPGWTERFISALQNFQPPNIGVVGPKHLNGKINILTYDFVHRTHLDIFGFYYPRSFTDWWGDDWITSVYQPGRSVKILDSKVVHTQQMGTRYTNQFGRVQFLSAEIEAGKAAVQRYILALYDINDLNHPTPKTAKNASELLQQQVKVTPKVKVKLKDVKVIAMSLWGSVANRTYGAIRNVNLARIFFPGWTVRVYAEDSINGTTVHGAVPKRVLQKLQYLGAELHYVSAKDASAINPTFWHYLVADDVSFVDRFLIRNPDSRLSERDFRTVELWEKSASRSFHCIRDHASHTTHELVDGLWGGKPVDVQKALNRSMRQELIDYLNAVAIGHYHSNRNINQVFLEKVLWDKISGTILCHDSVSCKRWHNAVGFPWRWQGHEYVGQRFDQWGLGLIENEAEEVELKNIDRNCESDEKIK